ncbi:MAG: hypothetical protein AB1423_14395 [Pseudomonadota bacterium]
MSLHIAARAGSQSDDPVRQAVAALPGAVLNPLNEARNFEYFPGCFSACLIFRVIMRKAYTLIWFIVKKNTHYMGIYYFYTLIMSFYFI